MRRIVISLLAVLLVVLVVTPVSTRARDSIEATWML